MDVHEFPIIMKKKNFVEWMQHFLKKKALKSKNLRHLNKQS